MKEAKIKISGRVQGVFFRANAKEVALKLGLAGYARNMDDDTVEALVQGNEESIKKFIEWCSDGPPSAKVDKVETHWSEAEVEMEGFKIY